MTNYPKALLRLIGLMKKLPGVGLRTAERYAFHMLDWKEGDLSGLGQELQELKDSISNCQSCGALLDEGSVCAYCTDSRRDQTLLCIVATAKDIFAIEDTREFRGQYHVLGGLLSPIEDRHPEHLRVDELQQRVAEQGVTELILALDSTLEGDATALYLNKILVDSPVRVSRLAFGIPMGSSLDYIDEGTLGRALVGRRSY